MSELAEDRKETHCDVCLLPDNQCHCGEEMSKAPVNCPHCKYENIYIWEGLEVENEEIECGKCKQKFIINGAFRLKLTTKT